MTGGYGFIGSNLVSRLVAAGHQVLVSDNLENGKKILNLSGIHISDFIDKDNLLNELKFLTLDGIFHLGACSATTEWDGKYVMYNNFEFTKRIIQQAQIQNIPCVYASSASIYGDGSNGFAEQSYMKCKPLNPYAYSKWLTDYWCFEKNQYNSPVAAARFFNVYGPNEFHKGSMASVIYHFFKQAKLNNSISIFGASHGVDAGMHKRDFIHVDDCVDALISIMNNRLSGEFNVGTGVPRTFNDVALQIKEWFKGITGQEVKICYIDMPANLKDAYQAYTCADLNKANRNGLLLNPKSIELGVAEYCEWLRVNV